MGSNITMLLNSKTPGSYLLYPAIWNRLSGRQWSCSCTLTIRTGTMLWLRARHGNLYFASLERVDGASVAMTSLRPFRDSQSSRWNGGFSSQLRSTVGPPTGYSSPLPCHFLYNLPIYSPFSSFPPFLASFSALPVLLGQESYCPSLSQFRTDRLYSPHWISVLLNCSLFSSPSSLRFCPVLQSTLLFSFVSWRCMW